jgi:hypothetical protein
LVFAFLFQIALAYTGALDLAHLPNLSRTVL